MFGGHSAGPPDQEALRKANEKRDREEREAAEKPQHPESFVVVLAYDQQEEDTSAEFLTMVASFKDLFSLRQGHRVYGLFDDAAREVLAIVEKPANESE